ncbi:MAG: hypothetical protein V4555_15310 [Acidobacteriota bacterium]
MKRSHGCLLAVVGMIVGLSGCHSSNPLIGKWKLAEGSKCGTTQLEYTATDYAGFELPDGIYPGWHHVAVSYNVSDKEVWLIPLNGGQAYGTRVFVIDKDHIKPDDFCSATYERAD